MTLCVYALAASPRGRTSFTGMSGERLRLISEGTLTAVVGALPRAPSPSAENLRGYDATLRALAARLPAVLPARFGTCFAAPDELAFVLRSRRGSLARALAHVRNRAQMTVRIVERGEAGKPGDAGALPEPLSAESVSAPESPSTHSGAAYLRGRAAAAARERHVPGFDPVRDAVRRWIRDERVDKRAGITTVYHLVPRSSAEAYRRTIMRSASAAGLQVVVTGPWPAYAFARW